jgi:excisionase family DNA binding protein
MSYSPPNIAAAAPSSKDKPARVNEPTSSRRPDAWRVDDAVRQLSISRATLYKMAKNGELRLAKVGGRTVVPDNEIRRLVGEGM